MWTLTDFWQGIKPRRRSRHRQRVRRLIWGLLLSVAVIGFPLVSQALTVQEVPNPQEQYGGWVTDGAGVLSEETEQRLNQKISELEAQNGTEIAVVTVRDTASEATPKDFATALFNHWGVGKADVDNGVLWLHSVGDRRIEIETGYGVEGILPDAQVGQIIDEVIIPQFREDDFDAGTLAGVEALVTVLSGEEFSLPGDSLQIDGWMLFDFGLVTLICWTASLLGYNSTHRRLQQPRELDPQGRSQVIGMSAADWAALGVGFCGFSICLGVLIPLLILNSSNVFAKIVILSLFGVIGVTAIFRIGQFVARSWKASFQKTGRDRYMGLLDIPVKLFQKGLLLLVGSTILLVIPAFLFFERWGHDLGWILLWFLVVALGMGWVVYTISRSWIKRKLKPICKTCGEDLLVVDESQVTEELNHSQKVAKDIGSTTFTGLCCINCYPEGHPFHLRSHVFTWGNFTECPNCQEFTVTHQTKTLVEPTYESTGLSETTYDCQACDYSKQEESVIPRLTRSTSSGGSSGGGGGGSGGGGSSGGGGAGGSY
ncbi:MAG: hypothetical protein EA395_16515 [Phormidium sp. GEM2.Bin31]|nr:MAG: hypothetical protein EA395_16515 [Phormidium sp. GEM2.Bin31]